MGAIFGNYRHHPLGARLSAKSTLNIMTQTQIANPYLDEYLAITSRKVVPAYGAANIHVPYHLALWLARESLIAKYGFAIPCQEAIEALVELSPIVEIGCGLAYWASLINAAGGEVVPYDINVNKRGKVLTCCTNKYIKPYIQVFKGGPEVIELHSDKTLFLCWPPYDTSMANACLFAFLEFGGKNLVYIGEGEGGCTADDAFHALLDAKMLPVRTIDIPVYTGIHDRMEIWQAKS